MEVIDQVIGADAQTISWWQMSLRGILLYLYTVAFLKLGGKQAFGKRNDL